MLFRLLKSVRLAIVLILVIITLSLLSTLVPQGREHTFYQGTYPPALYALITTLGFSNYFSSLLFVIPAALFALNLGACTVDRMIRQARTRAEKRWGPDIVHVALLVLVAGGLVTALARRESDFALTAGDQAAVTPRCSIRLLSFEYLTYSNGMPRAWISTVDVVRDGALETSAFAIRVNHPLRVDGVSVYQASWENRSTFRFRDEAGAETTVPVGGILEDRGSLWYLADAMRDGGVWKALVQEYRGRKLVSARTLAVTESLGSYTLVGVTENLVTGLRVVRDPGFPLVIMGVALLAAGLALTFIQNRRRSPVSP